MRTIGSKYRVTGQIIRTANNTVIPDDEPLMLLRGRDRLLPETLDFYLRLRQQTGMTEDQLSDLKTQIKNIKQWQASHPDRLNTPSV